MAKNNFLFHRDAILTTIFTYFLIVLLGFVFLNTKFLNPIQSALKDFQYTDVYFSSFKAKNNQVSNDIVLINISENSRADIVKMLPQLESFRPAVIALDITFPDLKNENSDTIFKKFIENTSIPSVFASQIEYLEDKKTSILQSHPFFNVAEKEGFGNFLAKQEETVRYVTTTFGDKESFATKILKEYDSESYQYLKKRNKKTEVINYSGNKFITFNLEDIKSDNENFNILNGKVVLIGYMGLEDGTPTLKDAHLTPLNKSFGGYALPDMYGIEIHAEILTMFLDKTYIAEIPKFVSIVLIGFFIALLHMYLFLYFFVKQHIWFHIVAKVFQLLSFGLLLFLSIVIFHLFNLKIEPSLMLLAVVLSVDSVYFFEAIMLWLNKKTGLDTYYKHHH